MKLKDIGKALQFPIAIFPVAAILNGIGNTLDATYLHVLHIPAVICKILGGTILNQMPLIFAVGIAYGLSNKRKSMHAINGLFCFLIVKNILTSASNLDLYQNMIDASDAFANINNQFIGILTGILSVIIFNKASRLKQTIFPKTVWMFIVSASCMFVLSLILYFVWPLMYIILLTIGEKISRLGAVGAGLYGFLNRLLLPIGMHHTLNSVFWFDVIGINDIGNFWSSKGELGVVGIYQTGFYPIMLGGIPAMALAMYQSSYKKQKAKVKSFYLSVALVSFFTGITEPLEFSFMFLAPGLYFIHCLLTGSSLFICALLKWTQGFSFSAGFIDYVLSFSMPLTNKPMFVLLLAVLYFAIYYIIFRITIHVYDLHIYGRNEQNKNIYDTQLDVKKCAKAIFEACGGKDNICHISCCTTRLRIEVKDTSLFDFGKLQETGAIEYKCFEHEFQIVYGTHVEYIYSYLSEQPFPNNE